MLKLRTLGTLWTKNVKDFSLSPLQFRVAAASHAGHRDAKF